MAMSLALAVAAVAGVSLSFGSRAALAGPLPCVVGSNCAPTNVNIPDEANWNLTDQNYCGIQGNYSALAAEAIDSKLDDPATLNQNREGNYRDRQLFQFEPNQGTSLVPGDTFTVSMPHPAEPYANSGAVFPQPQLDLTSLQGTEQRTSSVFLIGGQPPTWSGTGTHPSFLVQVSLGGVTAGGVPVDLSAFDPNNPQPLLWDTGQNIGAVSINGFNGTGFTGGNQAQTFPGGTALFMVTINTANQQDVVFAATDTTSNNFDTNVRIDQTASVQLNPGVSPPSPGDCTSASQSPDSTSAASPYILRFNNHGYPIPSSDVTVSQSSGVETATITVPPGVSYSQGQQVTLEVLAMVSPPGIGTQDHTAQSGLYKANQFTVATSEDPVPASPSNAPTYIADYGNSSNLVDVVCTGAFTADARVDGCNSTLVPSTVVAPCPPGTAANVIVCATQTASATNGNMVTATVRDRYNNPVNMEGVSVFQKNASHAAVTPQAPSPTQNNQNPAASTSGDDGTSAYSVIDTCAETVTLAAVDTSENVTFPLSPAPSLFGFPTQEYASIQFFAGQAVAPDSPAYSPSACGVPAVQSRISASPSSVAADGVATSTVTVALADQFGNAVPNQCVQLAQTNLGNQPKASSAAVTPTSPAFFPPPAANCPAGSAYSNAGGVTEFNVADSASGPVSFSVFGKSIPPWPSVASLNPADSAVVTFQAADPGSSTVTASRTTHVSGNGEPAATVTVTLLAGPNEPVQQKNVTLAGFAGQGPVTPSSVLDPTTTISPAGGVATDNNGMSMFTVADNCATLTVNPCTTGSPHYVTYQAKDTSDGVTISQTVTIAFTPGGASLFASPTTVVADGHGSTTVTFALTDSGGSPVSGVPVTLTSPSATASIVPSGATNTSAGGTATFAVTDTKAEVVNLTGLAVYISTADACPSINYNTGTSTCTVSLSVKVTFIAAPAQFTFAASPGSVPADGITSSQVTVTALDAGNSPISGLPIKLLNTGSAVSGGPSTAMTASNGQAIFTLTDLTAETVSLSAQYQSDVYRNAPGGGSVTFTETPQEQERQNSTITPTATAPADGVSTANLTVTLELSSTQKLGNHSVVLSTASATTAVAPSPITNVGGLTNGVGVVSFTITDTAPEVLTVYARDLNTGVIISATANVTFTRTEAQASTVTANPTALPAGGPTSAVTVKLVNNAGAPIANHSVSLTASSSTVTISPPSVMTTSGGQAVFAVSDSTVEPVTIGAMDTTGGVSVLQTATITFQPSEANQSTVTINPVSTPATGPPATLTVIARNASGQPIQGDTIVIKGATPTTTVTPLLTAGVTNVNGQAQFSVSDTAIQQETLSACDTTVNTACTLDPGGLLDQTATIAFTSSEAIQSSMSAVPTSLPAFAAGCPNPAPTWICPTTTVTVTLRNAGGALLAGNQVSLSATSSTVSITPAIATTNASGQAKFTVGDSVVQSTTLTALDRTTGSVVVQTVLLTFTANEANQSTATGVPGPGATSWTITVTLRGPTGLPLSAHRVTLKTGSKTTFVSTITRGGTTTSTGQIQFKIYDSATEVLSVTVTDTGTGVQLYAPVAVSIFR